MQGDDRLVADGLEQIEVVVLKLDGRVGTDDHRAEQLEAGAQRHTDGRQAVAERLIVAQLGVFGRVIGNGRLGLAEGRADNASLAGNDPPAVVAQEAAAGDRPQHTVFVEEDRADQRLARNAHLVQGQATGVERLLHDALEAERGAKRRGHPLQRLGAVVGRPQGAQLLGRRLADTVGQRTPGARQPRQSDDPQQDTE